MMALFVAVIEKEGRLKYCGMNSLDGGQYGRIIGAIIVFAGGNGYSDCNGSDG